MKHAFFSVSVVVLSLTACGDSPRMVSGNIEGVAYRFDGTDEEFKEVNGKAMHECQRFGRTAVLKNTSPMDEDFIANFGCVKS